MHRYRAPDSCNPQKKSATSRSMQPATHPAKPLNQWTGPATAIKFREEIISLVATGAYLPDIARKFGIKAPAISQQLAKDPEYQAAREIALETRLENREKQLEDAPPIMAEISRASALIRQAQWRCEREAPHRWGQRSHVDVTVRDGDLGDRLRRATSRTIEHEPGPVSYTHLRAHETELHLVCRLLLEKTAQSY